MKLRKSKLTGQEIVDMYRNNASIKSIQEVAGISRPAVYNILNAAGIELGRREVLVLVCRFCGEKYDKPRSRVSGEHGGYCSIQCFHADRSLSGEYSKNGGRITRLTETVGEITECSFGRRARKAIETSGVKLKPGQVIHHIDGNRSNNSLVNLRIFNSHSEHMQFHHSLRNKL